MTPQQYHDRRQAIINLPEARLRKATAWHLATRTDIPIETARRLLAQCIEDTTGTTMAPTNKAMVERHAGLPANLDPVAVMRKHLGITDEPAVATAAPSAPALPPNLNPVTVMRRHLAGRAPNDGGQA